MRSTAGHSRFLLQPWALAAACVLGALLSLVLSAGFSRPRPDDRVPVREQLTATLATLSPQPALTERRDAFLLARPGQAACVLALDAGGNHGDRQIETSDFECLRWRDELGLLLSQRTVQWPPVRAGAPVVPRDLLDTLLLWLAALALGALVPLIPFAVARQDRAHRRLVLGILLLAVAARLAWPWRWTAVYFAYEWLDQARYLDGLPRYGPGAVALWSWVLGPLTEDPRAVQVLQLLTGSVGCLAWSAAGARATGRWQVGLWVGLALSICPVLLRNDVSESMHVPALTALGLSAWGLVEHRRGGGSVWTAMAVLGFGVAILCRADLLPAAIGGLWALGFAVPRAGIASASGPRSPAGTGASVASAKLELIGVAAAAALALAVGWRAWLRAVEDADAGNLPQVADWAETWLRHAGSDVLLWRPDWWPMGAWSALILTVARRRRGPSPSWRWLPLLGVAILSVAPSWLDFNETSLPRLQAPAAVLGTLALGVWAEGLWREDRRLGALVAAVWLVSAVPTLPACWRETLPNTEDTLIRELITSKRSGALRALRKDQPGGEVTFLAVRSYADEPAAGLHLHWPVWWLRSVGLFPVPASVVDRDLRAGKAPQLPVAFLRSVRCHAQAGASPGTEQSACVSLAHQGHPLPDWPRSVPNLGDARTFDWYGRQPLLEVGIYQLLGHPANSSRDSRPMP